MPKYQLDTTAEVPSRAALRSFTGRSSSVVVSQGNDAGVFRCDESDLTSADDDLNTVVDYLGRRWKRLGLGPLFYVTDYMTSAQIADVRAGTGSLDVAAVVQTALDTAVSEGCGTVVFSPGTYKVVCLPAPVFTYGNSPGVNVYRAVDINADNITLIGIGATILVHGHGAGVSDVNYAFATDKNMSVGDVVNFRASGLKFDFNPTGDLSSTKRSFYFGGVEGVFLDDIELTSSGARGGATMTFQQCKTVRITNFRLNNCTQGINLSYVDDVQGANWNFNNFSEAVDFDRKVTNFHLRNLFFTNPTLAGQALDLNSAEDGTIDGVTLDSVLNGVICNYKYTTPPTYAEYVNTYPGWLTATAYTVGQYVQNADNFYVCTTGGVSAAAPTGTGTGIADGTVVWDYALPPFTQSPSKRVTISNVRGDAVGSSVVPSFNMGIDRTASYAGSGPCEDLVLRDVKLTNCGRIELEDVKRFKLDDVLLDVVGVDATGAYGGVTISADANFADADVSGELRNVTIRNCTGKGVRVTAPTYLKFDGVTVDGFNTANTASMGFAFDLQALNNRQGIIEIDRTFARNGLNSPIAWRFSENGGGILEPQYHWGSGNRIELATVPTPVTFGHAGALRRVKKRRTVSAGNSSLALAATADHMLLTPLENQGMYLCQVAVRTVGGTATPATYHSIDVRSRVSGADGSVKTSTALSGNTTAGAEVSVGLTHTTTAVTLAEGDMAYLRFTGAGAAGTSSLTGLEIDAQYIDYGTT